MKEKVKRYLPRLIVAAFFLIFLVIPVCLYTVLRFGFPPVIGNLLAARRMTSYAAQVHPDWTPEGSWAVYNLEDGYYWLSFTKGGQSYSLGCADGMIWDKVREEALWEELEIEKSLRINGLRQPGKFETHWYISWSAAAPEQASASVFVYVYEDADAPVLTQAACKEEMAEQLMEVCEVLAPAGPIRFLSLSRYRHTGPQEDDPWERTTLQIELSEGEVLTRETVLSGELVVK